MYIKQNKNGIILVAEHKDMCATCRYSGQSARFTPCAFIDVASRGFVSNVPYEKDDDYFYITNCGTYSALLKKVKDV